MLIIFKHYDEPSVPSNGQLNTERNDEPSHLGAPYFQQIHLGDW